VSDDVTLLLAWREGDRQAGGALIERNAPVLLRFFRNKVSGAVDDLVQQTFLTCVEHRDAIVQPERFRSYLLTVAHRVLIQHYRIRSRDDRHFDPLTTSAWDIEATPSTLFVEAEERRLLVEALRRIPLTFQVALELYYWQEMRGPELATVLDVPEGTVRSRLRRGRELLAEQMQKLASSEAVYEATVGDLDAWAASVRKALG